MITNKIDIFPEDFEEIKQGEYHRLKESDPKNFHNYTARIGHKYFKKKETIDKGG